MKNPLEELEGANPDLFGRPDMTYEQKIHTAVALGYATLIACAQPDPQHIAIFYEYLGLYAAGANPTSAILSACKANDISA